jgi:mycothiol synthase
VLLNIRPFRKGFDEETFVRIFNAAFSDYDDIRSMTLEEMKKMFEAPSFNTDGLFIAEWNGEAAGMVTALVDKLREEEKGIIEWLAVLPRFRGNGIAKKLVEEALESFKQRSIKVVDAWAQSDREGCVHIFESFGFKPARVTSMMKRSLRDISLDIHGNDEATIREACLEDQNEITLINRLYNDAFQEHFNYRPKPLEETKYFLLEIPWFKNGRTFFAIMDNKPVGFVVGGIDEELNKEKNLRYGWILEVGVLKAYRRKGVGARLMLHMMRVLKAQGMEDVLLYVDEMNPTEAKRLYEKLGFEVARKNIIYRKLLAQQAYPSHI